MAIKYKTMVTGRNKKGEPCTKWFYYKLPIFLAWLYAFTRRLKPAKVLILVANIGETDFYQHLSRKIR